MSVKIFIPLAAQHFVQWYIQPNNKENMKTWYLRPLLRRILQWPVDSPQEGSNVEIIPPSWHHYVKVSGLLVGSLELAISYRAHSRLAPSQWETSLQSNAVSHWLGANLESALSSPWRWTLWFLLQMWGVGAGGWAGLGAAGSQLSLSVQATLLPQAASTHGNITHH